MNYKRPKDIVIDEDFFSSGRAQQVMEAGQRAKYTQNDIAKQVLLATKNAKLQHDHVNYSFFSVGQHDTEEWCKKIPFEKLKSFNVSL